MKESRPVFLIHRVQNKLHTIRDKLFKLTIDRIVDSTQATERLALPGNLCRQERGAIAADCALSLQTIDFGGGATHPADLVFRRRRIVAGRYRRVNAAETAPVTQ